MRALSILERRRTVDDRPPLLLPVFRAAASPPCCPLGSRSGRAREYLASSFPKPSLRLMEENGRWKEECRFETSFSGGAPPLLAPELQEGRIPSAIVPAKGGRRSKSRFGALVDFTLRVLGSLAHA